MDSQEECSKNRARTLTQILGTNSSRIRYHLNDKNFKGSPVKWLSINKVAVKSLWSCPQNSICKPEIDLLRATFNQAIDCFNRIAEEGKHLPLADLYLILKKFQQSGIWSVSIEEDATFLYEYIKDHINKFGDNASEFDSNEIHRCMIMFYVAQKNHYSKEDLIKKTTAIFQAHDSCNTFTGLIHAYVAANDLKIAWDMCKEGHITKKHKWPFLYEIYFAVVFSLTPDIAKDNKTGLERARELYTQLTHENQSLLNTHCYRQILSLYEVTLKSDSSNSTLLEEVKELYGKIPEAMKNDHVRRSMLKILIRFDSLEHAEEHFEKMQNELESLTNFSYDVMIKTYYERKKYEEALEIFETGYKNNFKLNIDNNNAPEIDFHELGTSEGGTSFYGGKSAYFINLAIHSLLQTLRKQYEQENIYRCSITVKLISGIGKQIVRTNIENILKLYRLEYCLINDGCLEVVINTKPLRAGQYQLLHVLGENQESVENLPLSSTKDQRPVPTLVEKEEVTCETSPPRIEVLLPSKSDLSLRIENSPKKEWTMFFPNKGKFRGTDRDKNNTDNHEEAEEIIKKGMGGT